MTCHFVDSIAYIMVLIGGKGKGKKRKSASDSGDDGYSGGRRSASVSIGFSTTCGTIPLIPTFHWKRGWTDLPRTSSNGCNNGWGSTPFDIVGGDGGLLRKSSSSTWSNRLTLTWERRGMFGPITTTWTRRHTDVGFYVPLHLLFAQLHRTLVRHVVEYCEPHDGAAMELVLIWVEGRRIYDGEARRLLAAAGGVCVEGDASSGSK